MKKLFYLELRLHGGLRGQQAPGGGRLLEQRGQGVGGALDN